MHTERRRLIRHLLHAGSAAGLAAAWPLRTLAQAQAAPRVSVVAEGLRQPWAMAFLPDGRVLVSERGGQLRIVAADGRVGEPLAGLPRIDVGGQGGLLDVALDPRFADNQLVYFSFSEPADAARNEQGNSTAVARARLAGQRLEGLQIVFRQRPKVQSSAHFGSRLVFARDGRLFVTLGDRFSRRDDAQKLDNHHGKVVRIEADGKVPADNPFVGRSGALPEIWSYGHRNVQGAALHPSTGELWTHEHGPQGGDELNVTRAGRNHGWPVITYGREYVTGLKIGEGTSRADIVPPLTHWVPSIAPSGMAFVSGDRHPAWAGNLLVGALRGELLVRLELDGERVVREHRLLQDLGERFRDVRQAPDGRLLLLTDSPTGRILRLDT